MEQYPQVMVNVNVSNDKKELLNTDIDIQKAIQTAGNTLGKDGRILVRASGTEPLIRVMAEGKDHRLIQQFADNIAATIQDKLG